jgi:hypothetical protein
MVNVSIGKVRKAVAAAVTAVVVGFVSRWVDLDVAAVEVIVDAALVALVVWAVPNVKDAVDA